MSPTQHRASRIFAFVLKTIAISVGGVVTLLALMSTIGAVTGNLWARLIGAVIVAVAVPAFIADRALPDETSDKSRGLITDIFALLYMGFAVLFVIVGIGWTGGLLHAEAHRLSDSGWTRTARVTAWLGGPGEGADAAATAEDAAPVENDAGVSARDGGVTTDAAATGGRDAQAAAPSSPDAGAAVPGTKSEEPLTPAELFKTWAPSVVTIQTGRGNRGSGGGTGFVVEANGTVVTNVHVIAHATRVSVKLMDGTWAQDVELLTQDDKLDIAILKIAARTPLKPVVLGDSDKITIGERAVSIGNPLGLEHTLTDGLISSRRLREGRKMIQTSAPVSPGNSGGPLFNALGEVIGVTSESISTRGQGENLGLAVAINHVKPMLTKKFDNRKRIGGGSPEGSGTW